MGQVEKFFDSTRLNATRIEHSNPLVQTDDPFSNGILFAYGYDIKKSSPVYFPGPISLNVKTSVPRCVLTTIDPSNKVNVNWSQAPKHSLDHQCVRLPTRKHKKLRNDKCVFSFKWRGAEWNRDTGNHTNAWNARFRIGFKIREPESCDRFIDSYFKHTGC